MGESEFLDESCRELLDQIPTGLAITVDARNAWVNVAFCDITGFSREELIGHGPEKVVAPEALPDLEKIRDDRIAGRPVPETYDLVVVRKDGRRIDISVRGRKVVYKGSQAVLLSINDVTKRLETERELRRSREVYQRVLDQSNDAVCLLDTDGRILEANSPAYALAGVSPEDVNGKRLFDILAPESARGLAVHFDRMMAGEAYSREARFSLPGRPTKTVQVSVAPLDNGGFMLHARDLTAEKEAKRIARETELKLIQADRLSALGTMAKGMAHEINQPLTAIQFTASGMLFGEEQGWHLPKEKLVENLNLISRQVRRISEILRTLQRFARQDPDGNLERVDLNQVVQTTLEMFRVQLRRRGIDVKLDLRSEPVEVSAQFGALQQVLLNLIHNARDALDAKTGKGGKQIDITTFRKSDKAVLSVADNGPGLSPNVRDGLFVPFFTTKKTGQGTGIGLPISMAIVRGFEGTIEPAQNPDGGARFDVLLPAMGSEASR